MVPRRFLRIEKFKRAAKVSMEDGWPVFIRNTGGDATPQGPGIVNVSYAYVCAPQTRPSIERCYLELCEPIITAIESLGHQAACQFVSGSFCDGAYNVATNGRKIAGSAQRRCARKHGQRLPVIFAHALILVDADIEGGVAAINRFYKACGQTPSVDPSAHTNAADLDVHRDPGVLVRDLAAFLEDRYSAALRVRRTRRTIHEYRLTRMKLPY